MAETKFGPSEEAIKNATGKGWQEWFKILDKTGAMNWPHKQIVQWLHDQGHAKSGWWRQSLTVGYERARGLRVTGQTADAGFEIGVRKTLPIKSEKAWKLLTSPEGVDIWLEDPLNLEFKPGETYKTKKGTTGQIRTISQGERIRLTYQPKAWAQPSTLQIYFLPTNTGTSIGFHQEKLPNQALRESMRQHWKRILSQLEQKI